MTHRVSLTARQSSSAWSERSSGRQRTKLAGLWRVEVALA